MKFINIKRNFWGWGWGWGWGWDWGWGCV